MDNYILAYYQAIQNGSVVVGRWVHLFFEYVVKGLQTQTFYFAQKKANRAIRFIETFCHHCEGRDDLLKLELWQKAVVSVIFGIVGADGLRWFREIVMELINIQNQGITEGVKSAATFRFMAKLNNFTKPEDLAKERKRFTRENLQGEEGGVLLFPNTYSEIQQIKSSPFVVDAEQMQAIKENVYDYFGVNSDILQNKAYGDAWSAFYEGAIEPFAIQMSDVMTKMLFTERERASGAFLMATANRLQYMSNTEKLNVSAQMADRGIMNRDEIREIWNLPPLPNGQGQAYTIRGEYYLLDADGSTTGKGDGLTSGSNG